MFLFLSALSNFPFRKVISCAKQEASCFDLKFQWRYQALLSLAFFNFAQVEQFAFDIPATVKSASYAMFVLGISRPKLNVAAVRRAMCCLAVWSLDISVDDYWWGTLSLLSHRSRDTNFATFQLFKWDVVCDRAWLSSLSPSLYQVGLGIGSIVFGFLSDRFGRKPVLWLSFVIDFFASLSIITAFSMTQYLITRTVLGISDNGKYLTLYLLGRFKSIYPARCSLIYFSLQLQKSRKI